MKEVVHLFTCDYSGTTESIPYNLAENPFQQELRVPEGWIAIVVSAPPGEERVKHFCSSEAAALYFANQSGLELAVKTEGVKVEPEVKEGNGEWEEDGDRA